MNKLKTINTLLLITFCIAAFGQFELSELSNPDELGMSSDSLEKMNAYFHNLVDEKKLAGIQIGIVYKDKLVHFDTYGNADIENDIPLDDKSIFRIFSMTKPIVSVALMQLYEQGKFQLEDPVHKYIPEFRNSYILKDSTLMIAQNPVRIIDLLRHTSGYNYGNSSNPKLDEYYARANPRSASNNKEYIRKLSRVPLQFEPGTNWQYGVSTNICGYLVEVLSGRSLNDYLKDFIFTPLQMHDTHFQLPKEKIPHFTTGYRWDDEGGLFIAESAKENRYVNEVTLFNGGGGLVSTTFDYLKFCQMILNEGTLNDVRILKEETIHLMLSDHLAQTRQSQTERLRLPLGEASFGLGFAIRGENPESLEKVFGWGGAVGTYFKVDMQRDVTYVMMIQISPYRHLGLRSRIQEFINSAIIEQGIKQ